MDRLKPELNQIDDKKIREFTEYVLSQAPEYFWTVPSSSTGKYHPEQSNGDGGLIRHTRAVVYFAVKLCEVFSVTGKIRDCVISACLLHDVLKYGETKQAYTTKNHDYQGAVFVRRLGEQFGLELDHNNIISGCVAWHMGKWTDTTCRKKKQQFPDDYTAPQIITHLADVISAQKNVSLVHIS